MSGQPATPSKPMSVARTSPVVDPKDIQQVAMKPVKSSHIALAGHDPVSKTLQVQFARSGNQYQYYGVETGTYISMLAAKSIGQYFSEHVKGKYRSVRIAKH